MDKVQPPQQPVSKRKRIIRRLLIGLGVFAFGWAIYIWHLSGIERGLRAECQQRKEPVTLMELANLQPEAKDAENAAGPLLELWTDESPLFTKRFKSPMAESLSATTEIPEELGKPSDWLTGKEITETEWKSLAKHLQNLETRRPKLLAALTRSKCRFPIELEQGYQMLMPHAIMLRLEANNLCFDAIMSVQSNRLDRAIEDICAISDLARLYSQEPLLISQLVSASIYRQAVETGRYLLARQALPTDQLARLGATCSWYSFSQAGQKVIQSERAAILSVYAMSARDLQALVDPADTSADVRGYAALLTFLKCSGFRQADSIHMLKSFRAADDLVKNYATGDHVRLTEVFDRKPPAFPPCWVSAMLLPPMGRAFCRLLDTEAVQCSLLAALASEEFRLKTGKLPATMEELQASHPALSLQDPYQKGLLRYKTLEPGYVIYSVGRDGVDDDGRAIDPKQKEHFNGDLPFVVVR